MKSEIVREVGLCFWPAGLFNSVNSTETTFVINFPNAIGCIIIIIIISRAWRCPLLFACLACSFRFSTSPKHTAEPRHRPCRLRIDENVRVRARSGRCAIFQLTTNDLRYFFARVGLYSGRAILFTAVECRVSQHDVQVYMCLYKLEKCFERPSCTLTRMPRLIRLARHKRHLRRG